MLQFAESSVDAVRYLLELFFGEFNFWFAEIDVALLIHRDEVDMCMRHFQSKYDLRNLLALKHLFHRCCHLLGKDLESSNFLVTHIEDVINFTTRNDKGVSFSYRVNVEKGVELFVLSTFVAGNLTSSDLAEYVHNNNVLFVIRDVN